MLIEPSKAALMVIDVQEKLAPAIADSAQLTARIQWLIGACQILKTPTIFTEQYPKGLGHTLPALLSTVEQPEVVEKTHFSVVAANCLPAQWQRYEQVIVTGMEAHVCVLQTVLELLKAGKEVFVVADAVGSRSEQNRQLGLERMRNAGAQIVSREMVVFELLQQAGTEQFKTISKQFLRGEQP
ncbi:hydrolase [Oceanisphaera pacifica]|uniref:Hydrolase n=1 Tax=Oceanisphaera pacifica TaxID=2818389 RepID=A0ABS3NIL6_9GAMM|nr:hydrolase [Oceanisphaera pacifica]MBO1520066.1 hydrolase [Oceanisphaera pacifica]